MQSEMNFLKLELSNMDRDFSFFKQKETFLEGN